MNRPNEFVLKYRDPEEPEELEELEESVSVFDCILNWGLAIAMAVCVFAWVGFLILIATDTARMQKGYPPFDPLPTLEPIDGEYTMPLRGGTIITGTFPMNNVGALSMHGPQIITPEFSIVIATEIPLDELIREGAGR